MGRKRNFGEKVEYMVRVREDLTGRIFDKLIVIEQVEDYITPKGMHCAKWKCQCECGNVIEVVGNELKKKTTKSCGCWRKERIILSNKKYNDYEIQEDYVIMYTTKGEPFFVDLDDFWKVKNICWYINNKGYVKGKVNGEETGLHRYVMNCPSGFDVDHIHGKESRNDNRKSNLRIATVSQNGMNVGLKINNTSGITGVCWDTSTKKWTAYITINYKRIQLGRYNNFDDAVQVRREAEQRYFGEYGYNNSQELVRK